MMIRNHFNYDPSFNAEVVDSTSMAVPDQTYSVKELFQRMSRGLPLDDRVRPVSVYYDDDPDIDNPDPTQRPDFDLTDYDEEMRQIQDRVSSSRVPVSDEVPQREQSESDNTESD